MSFGLLAAIVRYKFFKSMKFPFWLVNPTIFYFIAKLLDMRLARSKELKFFEMVSFLVLFLKFK